MKNDSIKQKGFFQAKILGFKRKSTSEKVTYLVFFFFFLIMAVVFVYPVFSTLINSFRSTVDYADPTRSPFAMPSSWYKKSWGMVFTEFQVSDVSYVGMLGNSLWMLVIRVTVNVLASTFLAYAVARFRFPGKNFLYGVVIFSQTFPIFGAGAAGYKLFTSLNMINNPAVFWIAWCCGFDFAFIVLYGTFKGISSNYSEAAKIDGANNLTVLFRIIFPQAFPSILALAITQAIGVWNDFNTTLLYLPKFPTMAYGLFIFGSKDSVYLENQTAVHSAAIIISLVPIVILYAASQKTILTNMTAGGLKG